MRVFRALCWCLFALGAWQFAGMGVHYSAPVAGADARFVRSYGASWSPWLTRYCVAGMAPSSLACTEWRSEFHPASGSVLLLVLGVAAGGWAQWMSARKEVAPARPGAR